MSTANATAVSQSVTYDISLEVVGTVNILLAIFVTLWALVRLPRALALVNQHPLFIKTRPSIYGRRLPKHVNSCPRLLRPFLALLRMRVNPGLSVARSVVLVIYFFTMAYAGFFRSNIFVDPTRMGWLAISQVPVVFILAQKNNPIGLILGYGYEKLNYLHRFAGRLTVLAANIHTLHWFYKWSLAGTLAKDLKETSNYWGLISVICMDILFFFSTEQWRRRAYNIFITTHIIGLTLVLSAMYLHKRSMKPFIIVTIASYSIDHIFRILKSRLATASLRPLPELDMVRLDIPALNSGWKAGQHVRLRVLTTSMGLGAWMEVHPFTISSISDTDEGTVLLVKKAGGWTRNMYDVAKAGRYIDGGVGRDMKVIVEGPYGGLQQTIASSFTATIFIVGGSGISFALSAIQDLVQKDLSGLSRVKVTELIWIISNPASLAPLLPLLTSLINKSMFASLRIHVFYTRVPTGKQPAFVEAATAPPFKELFSDVPFKRMNTTGPQLAAATPRRPLPVISVPREQETFRAKDPRAGSNRLPHTSITDHGTQAAWDRLHGNPPPYEKPLLPVRERLEPGPTPNVSASQLPAGITLAAGRPRLSAFIEDTLQNALALSRAEDSQTKLSGLLVGVCGPLTMVDDVVCAVGSIDSVRRDQIGGVEIIEEAFGW